MKKKRTFAIIGSRGIPAEFGGFETFAEELAVRLVKKGVDVTVFCEYSQTYKDNSYKGVKLVYIKTPNIVGLRSIWFDIVNILKTLNGYDVVYMLGYNAAFAFVLPRLFRSNFWVNMDGLEWKRSKWSFFSKTFLRINEYFASKFAKLVIADAQGIADYLKTTYHISNKTVMIPYGANLQEKMPDQNMVEMMGLVANEYYLVVCRLEPENHVLEILNGFINSNLSEKLVIVGDHRSGSDYVKQLLKRNDSRVVFVGTIYEQDHLEALRFYCKAYIHGHSVGGTNPSLLEAMAANNYVIAHDNIFNREVTADSCVYFKTEKELSEILNNINKIDFTIAKEILKNLIEKTYNWNVVVNNYYSLLNEK